MIEDGFVQKLIEDLSKPSSTDLSPVYRDEQGRLILDTRTEWGHGIVSSTKFVLEEREHEG